jgi:hypothetical protein
MNKSDEIKYILVDFDGVISKNSLEITLIYAYDFINRYTPYHMDSLKNYYTAINSFELKDGLLLLFKSLGIEDKLIEFYTGLKKLKEYKGQTITIEADYLDFLSFCQKNEIVCKIFSLADQEKIENFFEFSPDYIKWPEGMASKANPKTYRLICESLHCNPSEISVIDDDPFVLRSAKLAGMKTILMRNAFFMNHLYKQYHNYIDIEVNSFSEIKILFSQ